MRSQQIGIAFLTLAGLALGGDETGSSRNSPRATDILLKRCTLEYKKTSLLGANQMGVLEECRVAPGDKVKACQVLGHLRDEEFRADLEARATQAASDIAIRVAQARHKLALSQLERTQKLINRNYSSVEELSIKTQEEEVERLSIEEARRNKKLAELQRKQSEAMIRSREIRSPHDGVVVEVLKVPGQSVSGLDSVLRSEQEAGGTSTEAVGAHDPVARDQKPSRWGRGRGSEGARTVRLRIRFGPPNGRSQRASSHRLPRCDRCLARAAGPGRQDLGRHLGRRAGDREGGLHGPDRVRRHPDQPRESNMQGHGHRAQPRGASAVRARGAHGD